MTKKNSISWQAYDYQYMEKSIDWYWVLYIVFLALIGIFIFFFKDWFFAGLLFAILVVVTIASRKKPTFRKYEITNSGIYLDDKKREIKFEDVESYFIDLNNSKILVNTNDKYKALVFVPFGENQNMDRVDLFLEKKIKKNPELRIPAIELIMFNLFGL